MMQADVPGFETARTASGLAAIRRTMDRKLERSSGIGTEFANASLRCIKAKAHLFTEGDVKTHVYKVLSGAACLYKVLADGRRQIVGFALEGDLIGLGSASIATYNAQAIVTTRLQCVSLAHLLHMAERDAMLALRLYQALSGELAATREHLLCVGQRGAMERLAAFLMTLSRRNEARGRDRSTIRLPMTRTDIADFLGLTIETVSRCFSRLKGRSLIEIEQISTIRLNDIAALAELADGHTQS